MKGRRADGNSAEKLLQNDEALTCEHGSRSCFAESVSWALPKSAQALQGLQGNMQLKHVCCSAGGLSCSAWSQVVCNSAQELCLKALFSCDELTQIWHEHQEAAFDNWGHHSILFFFSTWINLFSLEKKTCLNFCCLVQIFLKIQMEMKSWKQPKRVVVI